MTMFTLRPILSALTISLALAGCGRAEPQRTSDAETKSVTPYGLFSSATCFKNKMATMGFGQDVYTVATMEFRNDGTGTSHFELFTDNQCQNSAMAGSTEMQYVNVNNFGTVSVLQIDQLNDPNDPNSNMRYWMLVIVTQDGYLIDTNFENGTSGPFQVEPSEIDAQAFVADAASRGAFFQRQ